MTFPSRLLVFIAALALAACSTAPVQEGATLEPPLYSAERILGKDVIYASDAISDPWEGFNRTMYRFNYRFDKYLFLPAVRAYQWVTPDFFEERFHDFFTTWRVDLSTLYNSVLQANPGKTLDTAGRMLVNTTLGLLGFFDWATPMGIPRHQEDFGQTLGYWGVPSGPYLVLPILGPSSARDGVGIGVDWFARGEIRDRATDLETWQEWTWSVVDALDTRAHIPFRYYETGPPFEYDWVKLLYTTKRELDVQK
jgi:phospholipid-binding lipoprotein MlaA